MYIIDKLANRNLLYRHIITLLARLFPWLVDCKSFTPPVVLMVSTGECSKQREVPCDRSDHVVFIGERMKIVEIAEGAREWDEGEQDEKLKNRAHR